MTAATSHFPAAVYALFKERGRRPAETEVEEQELFEMTTEPTGSEDDDAPRRGDIFLYLAALLGAMVLAALS